MDSCACSCEVIAKALPGYLAALIILEYPVRLVDKVYAPYVIIIIVALTERYHVIVYVAVDLFCVLHHRTPACMLEIAVLEVVEGHESCHYIYLVILCQLEKGVKMLPVLLCSA